MSLKQDFVERAAKGEPIAALCREFGISRQTGHKWTRRFAETGYEGLEDRSRRPASTPLATAEDVVLTVLGERRKHPTWGPRKLAVVLRRSLGEDAPSERTIARILRRAELVRTRRKRRPVSVVERAPAVPTEAPNDVWTVDFKGWWLTGDGKRANPLTVRDAFSRFVLAIRLGPATCEVVKAVLIALFKKHGVPKAIQSDNGVPFISTRSVGGLSTLSAWLVSLGIRIVRSRQGAPQDNGAHERMHLDLSREVQALPSEDIAVQQREIDKWRQTFNHVRPHEAIGLKTPSEVYKPTEKRPMRARLSTYASHVEACRVYRNGSFRYRNVAYMLSTSLAGHVIGIEPVSAHKARAWFHDHDLGLVDLEPDVTKPCTLRLKRGTSEEREATQPETTR